MKDDLNSDDRFIEPDSNDLSSQENVKIIVIAKRKNLIIA